MHEQHEWVCEAGEVLNEYWDYANSAEECPYFGKVSARPPIDNLINSGGVCNVAFQSVDVAYNGDLSCAQ